MPNYHVTKKGGRWQYKKEHGERASGFAPTQAEAQKKAKEVVSKQGGGEVIIHSPKGYIVDCDTVAPKKDPFPPRDTKH